MHLEGLSLVKTLAIFGIILLFEQKTHFYKVRLTVFASESVDSPSEIEKEGRRIYLSQRTGQHFFKPCEMQLYQNSSLHAGSWMVEGSKKPEFVMRSPSWTRAAGSGPG